MKEIIAIVRRHNIQATKAGLLGIGIPALTMVSVEGRGKQKGLPGWNYELDPALIDIKEHNTGTSMDFIPKKMIYIVVEDSDVSKVVDTIIRTNQTGHIGDGKIFVCPVADAIRVRTGEREEHALR